MKLAVSAWYPYQHLATALEQLLGDASFKRVSLESVSCSLHDAALGPFLALVGDELPLPIVGVQAIVETMHRRHPERGYLPADAVERAQVRALAAMIEERFSRHCVAAISAHKGFGRKLWPAASDAPTCVIATPPALSSVEAQQARVTSRYLVGEQPSLADSILAALWWTAQDQGLGEDLAKNTWLRRWYQCNCCGGPFRRVGAA